MALEDGLDPMNAFEWELGGLRWTSLHKDGDEGLDDVGDVDNDVAEGSLDGTQGGRAHLLARAVVVNRFFRPVGPGATDEERLSRATELAADLDALKLVASLLPDRDETRLFRWRRPGEVAKRLEVVPSTGKPLDIPANKERLLYHRAAVKIRMTAPNPVIVSDEYETVTFAAGQTHDITNVGTFTAPGPITWWLNAPGAVTIEHLDYPAEWIRFPPGVTTDVYRTIDAPNAYGLCWGRDSDPFPQWPLLRPGINRIRASAACEFSWRSSW